MLAAPARLDHGHMLFDIIQLTMRWGGALDNRISVKSNRIRPNSISERASRNSLLHVIRGWYRTPTNPLTDLLVTCMARSHASVRYVFTYAIRNESTRVRSEIIGSKTVFSNITASAYNLCVGLLNLQLFPLIIL